MGWVSKVCMMKSLIEFFVYKWYTQCYDIFVTRNFLLFPCLRWWSDSFVCSLRVRYCCASFVQWSATVSSAKAARPFYIWGTFWLPVDCFWRGEYSDVGWQFPVPFLCVPWFFIHLFWHGHVDTCTHAYTDWPTSLVTRLLMQCDGFCYSNYYVCNKFASGIPFIFLNPVILWGTALVATVSIKKTV